MIFCNFILKLFLIIHLFFEKSIESSVVPEELIPDLYSKYKEAVLDEKLNTSSRRLFKRNKQYEIHVKKLKEVNGFKKHNLIVKENLRTGNNDNPYIYINNPVESKIPKSFLTLEEFKEVLTNRVKSQRNETATKQTVKIFNETELIAGDRVNKLKRVSKKLWKTTKMKTDTTIKTLKYKINGTTAKQKQISKTVGKIKNTIKLEKTNVSRNELNNVYLGNNTREINVMIPHKTTKFKLTTESETMNTSLEPKEPQYVSSDPSTVNNETKIDIDATEVTTTPDYERQSITSELLNENQLSVKSSDVQSTDTLTMKYDTKYEDESTTLMNDFDKNVNNTSPEINTNDYIAITTEEFTTNVKTETTEIPTVTETEVSTTQVTRQTAMPKSTSSKKVSFQVPTKRSTLGRPLVFMGGP